MRENPGEESEEGGSEGLQRQPELQQGQTGASHTSQAESLQTGDHQGRQAG